MLTATVSHDMRTPLNAIIGLVSNLEFYVKERGKMYLSIIQSSSKILLFLVNDLLDFFQMKNGKFRKNEAKTNIKESLNTLLDIFKIAASEKGIQINYVCKSSVPKEIITDEQRIKQVLLNLI